MGLAEFRNDRPVPYTIVSAVLVGLVIWLIARYVPLFSDADAELRGIYAAALVLLTSDVLETTVIAARAPSAGRIARWMYAFYHAYFSMVIFLFVIWDGTGELSSTVTMAWILGLVIFLGHGLGVFGPAKNGNPDTYNLDEPVTQKPTGRIIYYMWPLVIVLLLIGFTMFPPENGWSATYFLFQLVLLGSIFPLYQRKTPGSVWSRAAWQANILRVLGYVVLLAGLFLFR